MGTIHRHTIVNSDMVFISSILMFMSLDIFQVNSFIKFTGIYRNILVQIILYILYELPRGRTLYVSLEISHWRYGLVRYTACELKPTTNET
jgi:hypothetical protein